MVFKLFIYIYVLILFSYGEIVLPTLFYFKYLFVLVL